MRAGIPATDRRGIMKTESKDLILLKWARDYNRPDAPRESEDYDVAFRQRGEVYAAFLAGEINEDAAMAALSIMTTKTFYHHFGQMVAFFLRRNLIVAKRAQTFEGSWKGVSGEDPL
jgi:hypothetical protein